MSNAGLTLNKPTLERALDWGGAFVAGYFVWTKMLGNEGIDAVTGVIDIAVTAAVFWFVLKLLRSHNTL